MVDRSSGGGAVSLGGAVASGVVGRMTCSEGVIVAAELGSDGAAGKLHAAKRSRNVAVPQSLNRLRNTPGSANNNP